MKKRVALAFFLVISTIAQSELVFCSEPELTNKHEQELIADTSDASDELLNFFDEGDEREVIRIEKPAPSRAKIIMMSIAIRAALVGESMYSNIKFYWKNLLQWIGYGKK